MKKQTWKSLAWLMMCLCALTFTACGNDDSGSDDNGGVSPELRNKIVGTWEIVSSDLSEAPIGTSLTFNSDGTGYWAYENKTSVFSYTYTADNKFTKTEANGHKDSGTLIISDNVASFNFTQSGSSRSYTITFKKTSGGNNNTSEGELPVNIQNLEGTWQAISAKGTSSEGKAINTKRLGGLDSLDVPVLMVLYANKTFDAYNPRWEYPHSAHDNWHEFTWRQGDGILPNGYGRILLVGKQLQLIDSYRDEYAISVTIQSLTSKRLTVYHDTGWGKKYTVIYGRDGDGVDYFSNTPTTEPGYEPSNGSGSMVGNINIAGTWSVVHSKGYRTENGTKTDQWDEDVTNVARVIFQNNGTWTLMEYSNSSGTWHEDGSGTFQINNGVVSATGFEDFSLVSLTQNQMVIEYSFTEDKGSTVVRKYYHDTLQRIITQ